LMPLSLATYVRIHFSSGFRESVKSNMASLKRQGSYGVSQATP
ncbi:hypothetical protein T08_6347, partial [Trichinella sp. T8]